MKIILSAILLTAIAIGLWQNRELANLTTRENRLRRETERRRATDPAAEESAAAGSGRPQRKPLDAGAFVKRFEKLVGSNRPPSESERAGLLDALAAASPRELKALVEELRRSSSLPQELKGSVFTLIAPRLAESHPELAAEIAVEGWDGDPLRVVMRTWLAADPKAAAGWMKSRNPPLDSTAIRSMDDTDLKILLLAADVVCDPSGEALGKLLRGNDKVQLAGLGEVMMSTHPADFAKIARLVSQDTGVPEKKRMELVGSVLERHPDPAVARQILQDARLPGPQFIEAAMILMRNADPSTMRTSLDWFVAATMDNPDRTEALGRIWTQWSAKSPSEAEAYFREKNLPLPER